MQIMDVLNYIVFGAVIAYGIMHILTLTTKNKPIQDIHYWSSDNNKSSSLKDELINLIQLGYDIKQVMPMAYNFTPFTIEATVVIIITSKKFN